MFEGLIHRNALARASSYLDAFPVLVIEGARQVGKSTFAEVLVRDRAARLFTLDDERVLNTARTDPHGFVEQLPDGVLVIDEIQRAPELILPIKAMVDRSRRPGMVVLTGSSDLLKLERTPDSLAGRAVSLALQGFSQGERLGCREDFVAKVVQGAVDPWTIRTEVVRSGYASILAAGGYPELQHLTGSLRRAWLDRYLSSILQRDLADIHRRVDPNRLRSVLRLLAANQTGELVKARLAQDAQIPASSITMYLDVLEILFLVKRIEPWTLNLTKRETGRPKASVTDSALAMRLAGITSGTLESVVGGNEQLGMLLEGFVVSELSKQSTWSEQDFDLYHYRDRDKNEVDVVVELDDGRVIGIEVKANKSHKPEHFKGLTKLADRTGDRFLAGIVLNTAPDGFRLNERMMALPIAALWEA